MVLEEAYEEKQRILGRSNGPWRPEQGSQKQSQEMKSCLLNLMSRIKKKKPTAWDLLLGLSYESECNTVMFYNNLRPEE